MSIITAAVQIVDRQLQNKNILFQGIIDQDQGRKLLQRNTSSQNYCGS